MVLVLFLIVITEYQYENLIAYGEWSLQVGEGTD